MYINSYYHPSNKSLLFLKKNRIENSFITVTNYLTHYFERDVNINVNFNIIILYRLTTVIYNLN